MLNLNAKDFAFDIIVTGIGFKEDYKNELKSHLKAFEYSARENETIEELERKLKDLQSGR